MRGVGKRKCGCKLICKLRTDGLSCQRRGPKGKSAFTYHKKCASGYTKCSQMQKLEKNFEEFKKIKIGDKLEIPRRCIPFLGTKQRNYKEFFDSNTHEKCLQKREAVAKKTKLKIGWKSTDMLQQQELLQSVSESASGSEASSSAGSSLSTENASELIEETATPEPSNSLYVEIDNITSRISTPNIIEELSELTDNDKGENRRDDVSSIEKSKDQHDAVNNDLSSDNTSPQQNDTVLEMEIERDSRSRVNLENNFQDIISYFLQPQNNSIGLKEVLEGEPCPYNGIDEYFAFLKTSFKDTFFLQTAFLNEILLDCKKVSKKLCGYAYKKALENPWKFNVSACCQEFEMNDTGATLPVRKSRKKTLINTWA